MKIVIKQIDEKGINDLTYLMTDDNTPISANITSGIDSIALLERLMRNHVVPYCERHGLDYKKRVETVRFKDYIKQNG